MSLSSALVRLRLVPLAALPRIIVLAWGSLPMLPS